MRIDDLLPPQFVVAGTDTDVGKTVVAAILASGLRASYWKPLQSGTREGSDADVIRAVSGLPGHLILPEAYRLNTPISPHASAAIDGITIDPGLLGVPTVPGRLIIEGAGGLMVPINNTTLLLDIIETWGLPVLLVARTRLGTINHTLLSLAALKARTIDVVGVVMNGPHDDISRQAIEHFGHVRVLATVPPLPEVTMETIRASFEQVFGGCEF